jgi:hypothetical protein
MEEDTLNALNSICRCEFGCSIITDGNYTFGKGTCARASIFIDRSSARRRWFSHGDLEK